MLKKLIKYDLKFMLKLWWIAALAALVLSAAGAVFIRIISSDRELPVIIYVVAMLSLFVMALALMAFVILSAIIIYGRFYKNFFTDEGYLTFTLPVTRGQLLNSKLISMLIVNTMTTVVLFLCFLLMLVLGAGEYLPEILTPLGEAFTSRWQNMREEKVVGWVILYGVELLSIMLLSSVFGLLFTTSCITFGSIIAKRGKLAASIGIYFGANWLYSQSLQIFYMFGINSLGTWLGNVQLSDTNTYCLMIAMLLFCGVAIMGLVCSLLYTLQYWMLDRKLNLP